MNEKLVACPFCGSHRNELCADNDSHAEFYYVFCNNCEASGPTHYDRERAREAWNERKEADDEP